MSRIDYARTQSIDHRTRVRPIGKVNDAFIAHLLLQYQNVFFGDHEQEPKRDSLFAANPSPPASVDVPTRPYHSLATKAVRDLMSVGWTYDHAVSIIKAPPPDSVDHDHVVEVGEEGDDTRNSDSRPHRLIDTTTLDLVSWDDYPKTADYAVLSHRWDKVVEEVDYEQWQQREFTIKQDGESRGKRGYLKIIGACYQAKQEGIGYLWADTCCINKSDQTEFQEAIDSMFQYYENAKTCYALLSDVPSVDSPNVRQKFLESEWFRRGWTLQEMLAPVVVHFYAADWSYIGNLADLSHMVTHITRIPQDVLQRRRAIFTCSIAQRLSWASNRETKRAADRSYCLLGNLGVTMALQYADNAEKAFGKLQRLLLEESKDGDLSVLAWQAWAHESRNSLLANSPDDFAFCGNVEVDRESKDMSQFVFDNLGITGHMTVVADGSSPTDTAQVVLNCFRSTSPGSILTLHLAKDSCHSQADNVRYLVHPSTERGGAGERLGSINKGYPLTSKRISVALQARAQCLTEAGLDHVRFVGRQQRDIEQSQQQTMLRGLNGDPFHDDTNETANRRPGLGARATTSDSSTLDTSIRTVTKSPRDFNGGQELRATDLQIEVPPSSRFRPLGPNDETRSTTNEAATHVRQSTRDSQPSIMRQFELGDVVEIVSVEFFDETEGTIGLTRRFIVIRPATDAKPKLHALPIKTYNGLGVASPGVIKSDHSVVYTLGLRGSAPHATSEERARRKYDELPMQPRAILIRQNDPCSALDPLSRLDYGHPHSFDDTSIVRMQLFGKVDEQHIPWLIHQFHVVWGLATHRPDCNGACRAPQCA
ncbi:hypothetical protein LTR62_003857 [Meristemomyces frigidus]|uniref:Heterokaryon incompatibility domain-containing protein n=1 Tax=Meristemomyces frigidus TaxID=1508187 RepID=A0AAN7TGQ0_9PEZI|nr:hypothetical protein LTR62_003857 [Meristemomyces frigidus]